VPGVYLALAELAAFTPTMQGAIFGFPHDR